MDTKLTLSLNERVIEAAKAYAREQRISLSRMIENYLISLTGDDMEEEEISPLVKSLSGVLKEKTAGHDAYVDFLAEKYK